MGILPFGYGLLCLHSEEEREACRNAENMTPRVIAALPWKLGFHLEVLFGVFCFADGIYHCFAGQPLPPFA